MPSSTTLPLSAPSVTGIPVVLRKRGKTPTAVNLLKLAKTAGGFNTKKEARESLQNAGFIATTVVVEALLLAEVRIADAHRNREHNTILQRLGHVPKGLFAMAANSKPVLLPKGIPSTRLAAVRVKAVAMVARSTMRYGAAGGHTIRVAFALDASKVSYTVTMDQNRDTYAGAYKGWSANEDHHRITVPQDWRLRVERKGLASLGGMMTLDAHPLMPDCDVLVYASTRARQGRGYDVKVDRGYIAMLGSEHFHADTAQAAIKGVRRKVKSVGAPARTALSPYALTVDAFIARYEGRDLTVSVSDAQESGACDFGIRSWCEFVGLDYDDGEASLELVLQGFRARPQEEVRRAVLYAVRRHRAERRALAH